MSLNDFTPALPLLSAREVCQLLREVTVGRLVMTRASDHSWDEIGSTLFPVNVEGWQLEICRNGMSLDYCAQCRSPDGRGWRLGSGTRYGTDPLALLSTWELATLERLLQAL